jgi:hypothetical protein
VTKEELEDLVRFAYALWNKELFEADRRDVCRAWWALLKDLPAEDVRNEIAQLSLVEKFLPNPGAIRRAYKNARMKNPPPTPQQFWGYLQGVIKNQNSGTHQIVGDQHPVVMAALKELGAVAFTLTTNGDREYALEAYERCLKEWLRNELTVVEDA